MDKIIFVLLFIASSSYGQDSTEVKFLFPNESKFEIRIDNSRIERRSTFNLEVGSHKIEIWNGCMEFIYDTIFVSKGVPRVYQYQAKPTEEWAIFKKEKSRYNTNLFGQCALPAIVCASSAVFTTIFAIKTKNKRTELLNLNSNYNTSTSASFLDAYSQSFNILSEDHKSKKRNLIIFSGMTGLSGFLSCLGIINFSKKFTKPKLGCYVSPFSGVDYSLNVKLSVNQVSLSLNL
ncbi:MAG: hypothetical protein ACI857_001021 [Arenicella sp.]|jgi:hypothetical protein